MQKTELQSRYETLTTEYGTLCYHSKAMQGRALQLEQEISVVLAQLSKSGVPPPPVGAGDVRIGTQTDKKTDD